MAKNSLPSPPFQPSESNPGTVNLEYTTLLEEYKMLNARIGRELDSDDKSFEFNLVAVSATVIAISFSLQQGAYFLLLLLTIPFYLLTWNEARRIIWLALLVTDIEIIASRINTIIQETAPNDIASGKPHKFRAWESNVNKFLEGRFIVSLTIAMPQTGRAILQLSIAIALLLGYLFTARSPAAYVTTPFDATLVVINIVSIIVSIVLLGVAAFTRMKRRSSKWTGFR
jgi:hypothetical protein